MNYLDLLKRAEARLLERPRAPEAPLPSHPSLVSPPGESEAESPKVSVRRETSEESERGPGLPAQASPAEPTLNAETVADWAGRGEVVTIRSRTLGGEVYLVPDPEAGTSLVASGVPRHRIYLPAELARLANLLRLPAGPRAAAVRALDALREAFGPDLDVIAVSAAPTLDPPAMADRPAGSSA